MSEIINFLTRDIISFRWLCAKFIRLLLMPIAWLLGRLHHWLMSFGSNPSRSTDAHVGRRNGSTAWFDDDSVQQWSTSHDQLFDTGSSHMRCVMCGQACIGGGCMHSVWVPSTDTTDHGFSTAFDDQLFVTGYVDYE
jgi:hypothetical protein